MPQIKTEQEVFYRIRETERISGKKRSTIYKDIADGKFPKPYKLGAQSVAWKKSIWTAGLPRGRWRNERANRSEDPRHPVGHSGR